MTSILEREVGVRRGRVPLEIRRHPQLQSRFNAAAWTTSRGETVLLCRKVQEASSFGEPDRGDLVKILLNHRGEPIKEYTAWEHEGKDVLLEDPRALTMLDGRVMLGMTAVVYENDVHVPYPNITYLPSRDRFSSIPHATPIKDFGPGKNMTPINKREFLFRSEATSHSLLVLSQSDDKGNLEQTGVIDFPQDLDWASWRIGTTSPPIWINKNEALMFFHGITIIDGVFIYAIGKAKLHKNSRGVLTLPRVASKPFLQQEDLVKNGGSSIRELHPTRRAMYMCGHTITPSGVVTLFVSGGDTETIPVQSSLKDLVESNW